MGVYPHGLDVCVPVIEVQEPVIGPTKHLLAVTTERYAEDTETTVVRAER